MINKISKVTTTLFVVTFLIAGCASSPMDPQEEIKDNMQVMRDAVIENVKDSERQQKLLSLTKSLENVLSEYNKDYRDFAIEFSQLNRIYETPRAKMEVLLDMFRDRRKAAMEEVAALHFEMVANTSEKEWKKIVKKEIEALKSVRQLPEDKLSGES